MRNRWKLAALGLGMALAAPASAQDNSVAVRWNQAAMASAFAATFQEDLGHLSVVNANGVQYRWSRDGISFDLMGRAKAWTLQEAKWVRDALDKLPTVYLQKARASGMYKFYRDGAKPDAPWSFIQPIGDSTSAVAVPPSPWNFTAYSDKVFDAGDQAPTEVYRVVTHELGHCVQWNEVGWGIVFGSDFTRISWQGISEPFGFKSYNGFVSEYARTNHREDFAETAKYYWLAPEKLQQASAAKYAYMRDRIFGGLVSPQSARIDLGLPDRITPKITNLGDTSDSWYSLVQVHGDWFMGPFDGGYNRVYYGGTRATHIPVSEHTIYSWVPSVNEGWTTVKVATQDGWSNGASFKVEKPWWHFW
jgi:hypothetical protein